MKNGIFKLIFPLFILALPLSLAAQTIRTIAGLGNTPYRQPYAISGPAIADSMGQIHGVAVDYKGSVYISDYSLNQVRKVTPNGLISLYAGSPGYTHLGDGGPATLAELSSPYQVICDKYGNLFIADAANGLVRKVDTTGIITTIAGTPGHSGYYNGDGIPAVDAMVGYPSGLCFDKKGNLYIADGNSRVRMVDTFGIIHTVAGNGFVGYGGNGGCATCDGIAMNGVEGVTVDDTGNIYIAEYNNNVVRKVNTAGIINVLAGEGPDYAGYSGDGGPATHAKLNGPVGVRCDRFGNIYIVDQVYSWIRKVTAATGIITDVIGDGVLGFAGDGGPAPAANLAYPTDICFDTYGNIFVADEGNGATGVYGHRIREVFTVDTMHVTVDHSDTICGFAPVIFTAHEKEAHYWSFFKWQVNGRTVLFDTTATYTSDSVHDGDVITCQKMDTASGGILLAISDTVRMTVKPVVVPSLALISTGDTICAGQSVTLTADPRFGGPSPTYRWYIFGAVTDSAGPTFTLTPGIGAIVTCILNSDAICAIPDTASASATMYVNPSVRPLITIVPREGSSIIPADTIAFWGQEISLFSQTSYGGSSPVFQWYEDNVPVPGADSISFPQFYYSDHYLYCVMRSNAYCAVPSVDTSNTVHISVGSLVAGVSGTNDAHHKLQISPNPNKGAFIATGFLEPTAQTARITIIDVFGKTVFQSDAILNNGNVNAKVSVNGLADGFYLLKINSESGATSSGYFVVQQ